MTNKKHPQAMLTEVEVDSKSAPAEPKTDRVKTSNLGIGNALHSPRHDSLRRRASRFKSETPHQRHKIGHIAKQYTTVLKKRQILAQRSSITVPIVRHQH